MTNTTNKSNQSKGINTSTAYLSPKWVEQYFSYPPTGGAQVERCKRVNGVIKTAATALIKQVPAGDGLGLLFKKLKEIEVLAHSLISTEGQAFA